MEDRFGRSIDYLRISVIDNCNLRCIYCHDGAYEKMPSASIIKYEEILTLVGRLKNRGLKSVKITGGEPLIRKDLPFLIEGLMQLGIDVSLTTNGILLKEKAKNLYKAGLRRVNIGLDCLDKELFRKITGSDHLEDVKEGIKEAIAIGFNPVKINVVLIEGLNNDYDSWLQFAKDNPVIVRFIEVMPFVNGYKPVNNQKIIERVKQVAGMKDISVIGSGPGKHFSIERYKGQVGFISSQSNGYCNNCNRIRMNAQGKIRGCLFDTSTYDFLSLVRNGFSEKKLDRLIDDVLCNKPESKEGLSPVENMCQIGG